MKKILSYVELETPNKFVAAGRLIDELIKNGNKVIVLISNFLLLY